MNQILKIDYFVFLAFGFLTETFSVDLLSSLKNLTVSNEADAYFSRIREMNLQNPTMIGFGISDQKSFNKAAEYTRGAIVGSAFVKFLDTENALQRIPEFIKSIRP